MTEELRHGLRTWYGTLTLRPVEQYRVLVEARKYTEGRGVDWSTLSEDERFAIRARFALKLVTKYVKRFRKRAFGALGKSPMSWICITERHKSGMPHFHMLVHELQLRPITHSIISSSWGHGFERWRLVDLEEKPQEVAWYLCKYLTKDFSTRIRCSEKYGAERAGTVGHLHATFMSHALGPNETK